MQGQQNTKKWASLVVTFIVNYIASPWSKENYDVEP